MCRPLQKVDLSEPVIFLENTIILVISSVCVFFFLYCKSFIPKLTQKPFTGSFVMTQQTVKGCFLLSTAFGFLSNVTSKKKHFMSIIENVHLLKGPVPAQWWWLNWVFLSQVTLILRILKRKGRVSSICNSFLADSTTVFWLLSITTY